MWYLCQKVPLQRHQYHQPAYQSRITGDSSLLSKQFQATSAAYATAGAGSRLGGYQRDWEEYCIEDTQWQIEAKLGSIRRSARLGRDLEILSRL